MATYLQGLPIGDAILFATPCWLSSHRVTMRATVAVSHCALDLALWRQFEAWYDVITHTLPFGQRTPTPPSVDTAGHALHLDIVPLMHHRHKLGHV